MRDVSTRYRALIGHPNRWTTDAEWSNDGGRSWNPATYRPGGKAVCSSTSQIRWTCDLTVADVPFGVDGINAYSTQLRLRHGIAGQPLFWMGRYKVTSATVTSESRTTVQVQGSSHECYLAAAQFVTSRSFPPQPATRLVDTLVYEVLPDALVSWLIPDETLPKIVEPRERWALIDGGRDSTSIARSLGARIYAGPAGGFVVAKVPTLDDPVRWEAREGQGGVLLAHAEALTDEGVYNIVVASGQSTTRGAFRPGIAQDLDPLSPTYVLRPVNEGGFGPRPRFYTSELITSTTKAEVAARGMLAPYLGLRQQVTVTTLHDPSLEPGDVGLVHTVNGPRRVIPDTITYDLDGGPMSMQTRTTTTRLDGLSVEAPQEQP